MCLFIIRLGYKFESSVAGFASKLSVIQIMNIIIGIMVSMPLS